MTMLIDSYNESNRDTDRTMYSGYVIKNGNSFTAKQGKLSSCKFYLKKAGSPTGNAVATLYTHSGTYGTSSVPTGSALATSGTFNVTALTTSYQLIAFTFTGAQMYTLAGNTHYCIILEGFGQDDSNYITIGYDNSTPTHSGNQMYYIDSWVAEANRDCIFYVYAIELGSSFLLNFI